MKYLVPILVIGAVGGGIVWAMNNRSTESADLRNAALLEQARADRAASEARAERSRNSGYGLANNLVSSVSQVLTR